MKFFKKKGEQKRKRMGLSYLIFLFFNVLGKSESVKDQLIIDIQ